MKLLLLLLLSFSTIAGTTGTLLLKGNVPVILNLIVTPQNNLNLDLSSTHTDLKVADVRVITNSSTGYKVLISSANSGELSNGNMTVSYSSKFDSQSITLSTLDQTIKTQIGGLRNDLYAFEIGYTGQDLSQLEAGEYSDTLTFTVQVN